MIIKKYLEFEKIEEGFIHNIILGILVSFGVLTTTQAKDINDDKEKIEKVENTNKDVVNFLKFMKKNNIKLNHKYDLNILKNKYNEYDKSIDFQEVLSKLNKKESPISASIYTFNAPSKVTKFINIPAANLDIDVNNRFKVIFRNSGWFHESNITGSGIVYNFGKK